MNRAPSFLTLLVVAGCATPPGDAPPPRPPERVTLTQAPTELEPAQTAAPVVVPPVTLEAPAGALDPLYQALAAAEADEPDGRALIAQFGDSHTAGDRFTARLRHVLQARFGDGGRGFVLPGRPAIKHYELTDVRYGNEGAWKADQGGKRDATEPYGLGGVRSYASKPGKVAWVETCADCGAGTAVTRFEVFYLRQASGGILEVRIDDGAWQPVGTALATDEGDAPRPDYAVFTVTDGAHRLALRPKGRKRVDVFGVALERDTPGVVVDALGIVGLQMSHLWKWDWSVIGPQLEHRAPALVVLQYGTNEVDDPDLDVARFEQRYTELIGRVKLAVPTAAILILGPPDMARRADGRKCDRPVRKPRRGKRKPAVEPPPVEVREGCLWKTPPALHDVIDAQRRVAQATGVAFFDSLAAMGGADQIDLLVHAEPALAYKDRVHFTAAGYAVWADLVLEDLMRGYDAWQKQAARAPR